jgi:hypothetical protein
MCEYQLFGFAFVHDLWETYIDGFLEGSYFLAAAAELQERDESERHLER